MLIVANWKAYIETQTEAKQLFTLAKRLSKIRGVKIVLAPSFPHLGLLAPGNRSKVMFAAQNISETIAGPETGEVQGGVLKSLGATYVIIGHSERRAKGETDDAIVEKVRRALANKLTPILCVGERERDQDALYLSFLKKQLHTVFSQLSPRERLGVVVAYEPVWAIGKHAGDAITSGELTEMVLYIRKVIAEFLPGKSAQKVVILYGGSIEPENARGLAGGSQIDGFLVGHASVDRKTFSALVHSLS